MDATCAIQNSIHVFSLVHINMCPEFWVHIRYGDAVFQENVPARAQNIQQRACWKPWDNDAGFCSRHGLAGC